MQAEALPKHAVELLAPKSGDRVLDLAGGGTTTADLILKCLGPKGQLVLYDMDHGFMDSVSGQYRRETAEGRVVIYTETSRRLPMPNGSINGVIAFDVLETISILSRLCRDVHRVLVPNGHLVFGQPDFANMKFGGVDPELTQALIGAYVNGRAYGGTYRIRGYNGLNTETHSLHDSFEIALEQNDIEVLQNDSTTIRETSFDHDSVGRLYAEAIHFYGSRRYSSETAQNWMDAVLDSVEKGTFSFDMDVQMVHGERAA